MKDFRDLTAWRRAHDLALNVYRVTQRFPSDERYGLTSQLRRASVSIASNLAEGCGRSGGTDFARFCQIAMGSASEVEYQLLLAHDLGYLNEDEYQPLSDNIKEIKRMVSSLITKLRSQKS